ncbi:chemotaxis protein CheW [Phosphitispora fastidiosa]|uniref:chemotaxis protein CheW n=1 Tax=Phosphitispora fastidiosa TaxID=2837202 RepID=UPI001E2AFA16|nr:chemotaxis protein CheW [Phosphitispora fastidiosa]MBU7006261.1 purine-binding chemotaxis protein CheW [Phosphitispora fastidiosa]
MEYNTSEGKQYVVFRLSMEVFGLEINRVKEIIIYQEYTNIPGAGELVEGVINLRGHVIPIFNLRKKFGFPQKDRTGNTRIVVVEANNNTVGLVVDSVSEVLAIPGSLIEEPSAMLSSGLDANFITGIAKIDKRLVIVLDLEKVVSIDID